MIAEDLAVEAVSEREASGTAMYGSRPFHGAADFLTECFRLGKCSGLWLRMTASNAVLKGEAAAAAGRSAAGAAGRSRSTRNVRARVAESGSWGWSDIEHEAFSSRWSGSVHQTDLPCSGGVRAWAVLCGVLDSAGDSRPPRLFSGGGARQAWRRGVGHSGGPGIQWWAVLRSLAE